MRTYPIRANLKPEQITAFEIEHTGIYYSAKNDIFPAVTGHR